MKIRLLMLGILMAFAPCVEAANDYWTSSRFEPVSIPSDWADKAKKTKVKDYEYISDWDQKQLRLDYLLSELGLPDRYLRNKKDGTLYMIYDFEGRHTLVVYLIAEKTQNCAAAALIGPDGKTIKLIK